MKKIVFYSFLALGVLGIAIASASYAHNSESWLKSTGDGSLSEKILQKKADFFGLTTDELKAKLDEGITFKEIAQEQDITKEDFREQMEAKKEAWIAQMLEDGLITQEQLDAKMQSMEEHKKHHYGGKGFMGMGMGGKGFHSHE